MRRLNSLPSRSADSSPSARSATTVAPSEAKRSASRTVDTAVRSPPCLGARMSSDVTAAAFGLAGALIGGGVTFGATYLADRTARQQARLTRIDKAAEVRRQACVGFLRSADAFRDRMRELTTLLEEQAPKERFDRVNELYEQLWAAFAEEAASVEICGPPELAGAAQQLRTALGHRSELVDARRENGRWPRGAGEDSLIAITTARETFLEFARGATTSQ